MQEKHDELIELIRLNPVMRSCVQRMVCETVPSNVILKESNKPLKPELQRLIGPYFSKFLADGIEMAEVEATGERVIQVQNSLKVG